MATKKPKSFDSKLDKLLAGLELPSDKEIRKETGYKRSSASKSGQKRSNEQKIKMSSWQIGKSKTEAHKDNISVSMKGKKLEEILGDEEKAAKGKEARSRSLKKQHASGSRCHVGQKTAATRKANGSYESPTHGMNGKKHTASTRKIQAQKAKIRQEIKRKYKLGKSDKIPKDLLAKEYKKAGLL